MKMQVNFQQPSKVSSVYPRWSTGDKAGAGFEEIWIQYSKEWIGEMIMVIISLILCLSAIICAAMMAFGKNKHYQLYGVFCCLCCSLPAVLSMYDVIWRAESSDVAGILDIYPTMINVWLCVIGIVTVLNIIAIKKVKN